MAQLSSEKRFNRVELLDEVSPYNGPTVDDPYRKALAYDKLRDASDTTGYTERALGGVHKPPSHKYATLEIRRDEYDRMKILQQAKGLSSIEELLEVIIEEEVKRIEIDPFRLKPYKLYDEDGDLPF